VLNGLGAAGWEVPETHANFVWLPLGDDTVAFSEAAEAQGVSVRPFAGDGARVTIGEPEANDLFLAVATKWRS
jgi:histidinol-phosphate aminotransferase